MSYCRWSTDDFQCDLYVYEHVGGGFIIHVAGNKVIFKDPLPPQVEITEDADAWFARYQTVMKMIDECERVPLDLPHDGESFHLDTAAEAADKVEELLALGYRCPDDVVPALRSEAAEEAG